MYESLQIFRVSYTDTQFVLHEKSKSHKSKLSDCQWTLWDGAIFFRQSSFVGHRMFCIYRFQWFVSPVLETRLIIIKNLIFDERNGRNGPMFHNSWAFFDVGERIYIQYVWFVCKSVIYPVASPMHLLWWQRLFWWNDRQSQIVWFSVRFSSSGK